MQICQLVKQIPSIARVLQKIKGKDSNSEGFGTRQSYTIASYPLKVLFNV